MKTILSFVFMATLLFGACTEKTQVNLVNGTLFQDCDNRLANTEMALKANIGGSFNNQIILGSAISDANGGFSFTYELDEEDTGTGDLILIKSTGFETLVEGITLNADYTGTLYRNSVSTVQLSLSGTRVYSATDTLYYGVEGNTNDYFAIQPSVGVLDTLASNSLTNNQSSTAVQLYYGIGKAAYDTAKTDTSFNNITVTLSGCNNISVADIEIN